MLKNNKNIKFDLYKKLVFKFFQKQNFSRLI